MYLLAGKPASTPAIPVRREDAVRWIAFWCDRFFPMAVQKRNRRNLSKIATEVWKSWAVAQGVVAEPYLTLREAVQRAKEHPIGRSLQDVIAEPWRSVRFIMRLAGMLHDSLFPPLRKLREPRVYRLLLPPRSRQRVLVILPHPDADLPEEAFEAQSLLATPELLHLYLHYLNPFSDWTLPPDIRELGYSAPTPHEYVRAGLFNGQDNNMRLPGFVRKDGAWLPITVFSFNRYSIPYLANREVPPPMPEKDLRDTLMHACSCEDYYLHEFPRLHRAFAEQLAILEQMETPGTYPA